MSEGDSLVERNGWLYICTRMAMNNEPTMVCHFYSLQVRFSDFAHRFASEEEARKAIGRTLSLVGSSEHGLYRDNFGMQYRLPEGGKTRSAFLERLPIAPPRQRGKSLPVEWRQGRWYKCTTTKGWVPA